MWIRRLKNSFGAPFLFLIISIYWTQGFRSFIWMGISYQMKDQLNLSPSSSQFLMSTSLIPWSIKPLYGVLSDCVPIRGGKRIPYLIISSILTFFPCLILGGVYATRASYIGLMTLLAVQNLGAAMADVVIDAMVAENARQERAEHAGDLQSLSWMAMAFGGIIGSLTGGLALKTVNVGGIFLLFSMFPFFQLLACILIDEKSLHTVRGKVVTEGISILDGTKGKETPDVTERKEVPLEEKRECECNSQAGKHSGLTRLEDDWIQIERMEEIPESEVTSDFATAGSSEVVLIDKMPSGKPESLRRRKIIPKDNNSYESNKVDGVYIAVKLTFSTLWAALKQPTIWRPMLWFLLSQISIPNLSTIMFYYETNHLQLDASFLGTARVIGWLGLMIGTSLYNRHLKKASLRKVFRWVHISLAILTLVNLILVLRWNLGLGISDKAFIMGTSALGDAVHQFKFMPFLVLSGQLCPPGIEGTLFALFMSINNFGATVSSFSGATLASAFGISSHNFGNLYLGIIIQALCTLIPLLFMFLIPQEAILTEAHRD